MGSFFEKVANNDPLAGALNLPGSQSQYATNENNAAQSYFNTLKPYQNVAPTLAAANAGYVAGGPGSNPGAVNAPTASQTAPTTDYRQAMAYTQAAQQAAQPRQQIAQQPAQQFGTMQRAATTGGLYGY